MRCDSCQGSFIEYGFGCADSRCVNAAARGDSSAEDRALIHRLTRPRAPRRVAHPAYTVLMRRSHDARKGAVDDLAAAIREVPGVAGAKAWLNDDGTAMRVYLDFGPRRDRLGFVDRHLDVRFGDLRMHTRALTDRELSLIDDGAVRAISSTWAVWARSIVRVDRRG